MNVAKDTIAAISTPTGFGGIGIVRISGPGCGDIVQKLFRKSIKKSGKKNKIIFQKEKREIIPRRMNYGYIVDPENPSNFNEALMVFMPSPNSFTREDVAEIQAHGGIAAIRNILEIVNRNGARLAEPGEFTKRAYLNGRIDLSQVEAIIDIIQAKTEASLKIANRNLEGGIGKKTREVKQGLFEIKVLLEAQIDFPEDVDEKTDENEPIEKILKGILNTIKDLLDGYEHGHLIREGVRIVIIGRTNVGKSSLLNRLMKRERAIVTSYPGTTRDSIEEIINLFGIPAVVVDTAGWRNSDDPVEKIGIERSRELAINADLILFMVDAGSGIVEEDEKLYSQILKKEKLLIINKSDLIKGELKIKVPEEWIFSGTQYTSAKFGDGLESLKEKIYKILMSNGNLTPEEVVPNLRQKELFQKTKKAIETVLNGLKGKLHPELIAIDVNDAMEALDEITGDFVKKDVLDEIFSRFCIGK